MQTKTENIFKDAKPVKVIIPFIDADKPYSTVEMHIMRLTHPVSCELCKKKFKDGNKCQLYSHPDIMKVGHFKCVEGKEKDG